MQIKTWSVQRTLDPLVAEVSSTVASASHSHHNNDALRCVRLSERALAILPMLLIKGHASMARCALGHFAGLRAAVEHEEGPFEARASARGQRHSSDGELHPQGGRDRARESRDAQ